MTPRTFCDPTWRRRAGLVAIASLLASTAQAQSRVFPRAGMSDSSTTIDPRPAERDPAATRAEVRIVSSARAANVYLDGVSAGVVDDFDGIFQSLSVAPGAHDITLYLEGFRTVRHRVYLTPGSTLTIRPVMARLAAGEVSLLPGSPEGQGCDESAADLEPPLAGRLTLRVAPGSATVTVDGESWASSSVGFFEFDLPVGAHVVAIQAPNHEVFSRRFTVKEGATTSLRVRLARLATK